MLFLCLTLGMALRKLGQFPDNAHVTINAFIVKIALPALILQQIHNVKLDPTMIYAVLMCPGSCSPPALRSSGSLEDGLIFRRKPPGRSRSSAALATLHSWVCR